MVNIIHVFLFFFLLSYNAIAKEQIDRENRVKSSTFLLQNRVNINTSIEIDEYVKKIQNNTNIPNISIGIIKNDSVIYQQSYSKDNSQEHNSLFYIGSLTKSFTALAIMQLVEKGEVNLNDSIKKYFPWIDVKDGVSLDKITIETLLNQTSGFSTFDGLKNFNNWDSSELALEKAIRNLHNVSLVSNPSEEFNYSNLNYQILGLVIEKVSGLSYSQYIQKYIFDKLGMKYSSASLDSINVDFMAQGHRLWFGHAFKSNFPFNHVMLPAGYIVSNIGDMSRYLIAQLNNGQYENRQIFAPSIIEKIQMPSATVIKDKLHYGFGWFINTETESRSHLGVVPGYTSAMIIYPKQNLGLIVLTNAMSYTFGKSELNSIADGIMDILKGNEPQESGIDFISFIAYLFFIGLIIVQLLSIKKYMKKLTDTSKYRLIATILLDITIITILFILVPRFYNLTFSGFLMFVPDIGYLMFASIIIALVLLTCKSIILIKILTNRMFAE